MTTACIIQARLGSSRLPAKVLLPLPTGNTVLEEVILRCSQIMYVDNIVVATPDKDVDQITFSAMDAIVVGGSEHNVLERYYKAACRVGADTIIRITADCPMIDLDICEQVLLLHMKQKAHYTSNVWPARQWPPGYDCEVFSMEALAAAHHANIKSLGDMEHVTPLIQKFADQRNAVALLKSMGAVDWTPRTLDTLDDYRRIWSMMVEEYNAIITSASAL